MSESQERATGPGSSPIARRGWRSKRITLSLYRDEYQQLRLDAARAGVTMAEYLGQLILAGRNQQGSGRGHVRD